jgi:hypothetical protein
VVLEITEISVISFFPNLNIPRFVMIVGVYHEKIEKKTKGEKMCTEKSVTSHTKCSVTALKLLKAE